MGFVPGIIDERVLLLICSELNLMQFTVQDGLSGISRGEDLQASDYEWKTKERHAMQGHNTCKAKGIDELVSSDSWTPVRLAKRRQD